MPRSDLLDILTKTHTSLLLYLYGKAAEDSLFYTYGTFNMSIWNRLRQTIQRNRNWLNANFGGTKAVEIAIYTSIPYIFLDWGAIIPQDSATFKELHRPRSISYSKDDNPSGGWH